MTEQAICNQCGKKMVLMLMPTHVDPVNEYLRWECKSMTKEGNYIWNHGGSDRIKYTKRGDICVKKEKEKEV